MHLFKRLGKQKKKAKPTDKAKGDDEETRAQSVAVKRSSMWLNLTVNNNGDEEGHCEFDVAPSQRYGHSFTYLPLAHSFVLFGGSNQVEFSNEVFEYRDHKWKMLQAGSEDKDDVEGRLLPLRRHFHSALLYSPLPDEEGLLIFGGKSNGYLNDIWHYIFSTNTWQPIKPDSSSRKPVARYGHIAALLESSKEMFIFGGFDTDSFPCADSWTFSLDKLTWKRLDCAVRPPARYLHSATIIGTDVWIFGGQGEKGPLADVWVFHSDSGTWEEVTTRKQKPTPRYGHSCVSLQSSIIVFGGYNKQEAFADIYELNVETRVWTKWEMHGEAPLGLFYHAIAVEGNNLITMGGRDLHNSYSNQVHYAHIPVPNDYNGTCAADNLPDEVLLYLFSFISDAKTLCQLCRVNRRWAAIANETHLWERLARNVNFPNSNSNPRTTADFKALLKADAIFSKDFTGLTRFESHMTVPKLADNQGKGRPMKIVVVGDGATGKTCALLRLATHAFPIEYIPTVFDNTWVRVNYKGEAISISLWDTGGGEDYDRLRALSYPLTDVFMLTFSMVAPTSFANITSKWVGHIRHYMPNTPIMLVGTKMDLVNDAATLKRLSSYGLSPTTVEQGFQLAKQIGAAGFVPTSAVTGMNIYRALEEMVRVVVDDHHITPIPPHTKSNCSLA